MTCSPVLSGEPLSYKKEGRDFRIYARSGEYVVECSASEAALSSRNKNIQDRRFRMEAIDLMGAYILFSRSSFKSEEALFQIFADATQLHYQAYLTDLVQEEKTIGGKPVTVYRCKTENYILSNATYREDISLEMLVKENYRLRKDAPSVELLERYRLLDINEWLQVERDFLTGDCSLPALPRRLQGVPDRLERSLLLKEDPVERYRSELPTEPHYRIFFLEEVVTSIPAARKAEAYEVWIRALDGGKGTMAKLLLFCARKRETATLPAEPVFTDVIDAFPGAVSPFGVRTPLDRELYDKAVAAYAKSDFSAAAELLSSFINENGLMPEALNLYGASLRYQGFPARALPYFLLALKADPSTPYVTGNLALALKDLEYPSLTEALKDLLPLADDPWSRQTINQHL